MAGSGDGQDHGRGRVPVVIVGAGPTGLTAATLLAQHGVRSLVLERHTGAYPLPRAVHVDDEVLRILQQVGIAEEFAAISRPAGGLRLLDARHRVIAEFRRDSREGVHGHPQANLFDQPDLELLLRQNLARYPGVELREGVEVVDVRPADGETVVRFQDVGGQAGSAQPKGSIRAQVVLGCDGANSLVRRCIGARLEDLGFEERWLVLDLSTSTPLRVWDGVEQVCDPGRAATFMRIGADRYRWEFRLRPGEEAAGFAATERLGPLVAPWLEDDLDPAAIEVRRCTEYTFRARLADRWRRQGIFLLGDAAHLTPPFVGQGLGSGLRDAYNLAWKLAFVLGHGPDDRLLDSYQAERRPHARALIRLAILTGWAMTGGQDRAAAARRVLLGLGCRVPGMTDLILSGTSPRLGAGPLVRRRSPIARLIRPGRDLGGTMCPQPRVRVIGPDGVPGPVRRLDDVLGVSFTVLTDGPLLNARLVALGRRLQAQVIELSGPGSAGATRVDSPELRRWMTRARVRSAVLRPDRVVLAAVTGAPVDMVAELASDPL